MGLPEAFPTLVILVVLLAPQKEALPEEWHFLEVELQCLDGVGSRGLVLSSSCCLAEAPDGCSIPAAAESGPPPHQITQITQQVWGHSLPQGSGSCQGCER